MPQDEMNEFKKYWISFLKWRKYMKESRKKVSEEKFKEKWIPKFIKDICDPLDKAWGKLTTEERNHFSPTDTRIPKRENVYSSDSAGDSPF